MVIVYPFCVNVAPVVVSVTLTLNVTVAGDAPGVPLMVSGLPAGLGLRLSESPVTCHE